MPPIVWREITLFCDLVSNTVCCFCFLFMSYCNYKVRPRGVVIVVINSMETIIVNDKVRPYGVVIVVINSMVTVIVNDKVRPYEAVIVVITVW